MTHCSVLPVKSKVTEEQFSTWVIAGLARAQVSFGTAKALAYVMELSTKGLGLVMAGGSTSHKRLWDVHAVEGSALSDIADGYGFRIVPKEAVCTTDKALAGPTCALLRKAIDAEMDGVTTHQELLGMEAELREMRALIDVKLAAIAALRAPRAA